MSELKNQMEKGIIGNNKGLTHMSEDISLSNLKIKIYKDSRFP